VDEEMNEIEQSPDKPDSVPYAGIESESERQLKSIVSFLPDATFAIDKMGRVIAWNRAMENMTGVKADEILGIGDYEYSLPFYGFRRPILIDLVLQPDPNLEAEYESMERRHVHHGRGIHSILWKERISHLGKSLSTIRFLW
jgi:PAS domain-containing protein